MKVLGIIPARFDSSRFPGKPLIDIAGKTMIQRVYEQAEKCESISQLIVATDDQRIVDHVKNFGGNVMLTSKDHKNGTERCGEVIKSYFEFDVVINIQGDEPLIKPEQLHTLLDLFKDENVSIGTLVKKLDNKSDTLNPNRIKVVLDKWENAIYFSRNTIPFSNNLSVEEILKKNFYFKHIGIYAWRLNTLVELLKLEPTELESIESLEQLRWLYNGYQIRTAETTIETPNIDTPEDLEEVLRALKA